MPDNLRAARERVEKGVLVSDLFQQMPPSTPHGGAVVVRMGSGNPVEAAERVFIKQTAGTRSFSFTIVGANGTEQWTSGPQKLTVSGGLYGVVLGTAGMPALPQTLPLQADLNVHISVEGVELYPDVPLIPALQASTAWTLRGYPSIR